MINAASLKLVKDFEGFVGHWYPDPATHAQPFTCCYGHTDAAGAPFYQDAPQRQFTEAEGSAILQSDLDRVGKDVLAKLTIPVNANQFGALVSFTFNLGLGNFTKSTLLKKVNAGDFAGAAKEFGKWNRAAGKVMAGLTKRRAAEAKLFGTPV